MKLKRYFSLYTGIVFTLLLTPGFARAQFGGSQIVFDPQMFARQLAQLQEETASVTDLAQQLQYMVKNTTGGGAGVWQSNQNLLTNLGGLISEQQGLSYTFQGLAPQFQQLYPGYNATNTPGVQSPMASTDTTLNTLNGALQSVQAQAIQVSNEIALAQVQQVQMLRQLVMAMTNSQNVATANQLNSQTQSQLGALAIIGAPPPPGFPQLNQVSTQPPPPQ